MAKKSSPSDAPAANPVRAELSSALKKRLLGLPDKEHSAEAMSALRAWDTADLARVAAWIVSKANAADDYTGISDQDELAFAAWAERDYGAAYAALQTIKPGSPRLHLFGTVLSVQARQNVEAMLNSLARDIPPGERVFVLSTLMEHWTAAAPQGAVQAVTTRAELMSSNNAVLRCALTLGRMMSLEEGLALVWQAGHPGLEHAFLRNTLLKQAEQRPAETWAWYAQRAGADLDSDTTHWLFQHWVAKDRPAAMSAVIALPNSTAKTSAVFALLNQAQGKSTSLDDARVLLAALPADERQMILRSSTGERLLTSEATADSLLSLAVDDADRSLILQALAERAAMAQKTDVALGLVAQISNSDERRAVLAKIGSKVAHSSPAEALRWVQAQPASEGRDWTLAGISSRLLASDRQSALDLLPAYTTDSARRAAMMSIAVSWARHAPAEAQAWVARQPLLDAPARALIQDAVAHGSSSGWFLPNERWTTNLAPQ